MSTLEFVSPGKNNTQSEVALDKLREVCRNALTGGLAAETVVGVYRHQFFLQHLLAVLDESPVDWTDLNPHLQVAHVAREVAIRLAREGDALSLATGVDLEFRMSHEEVLLSWLTGELSKSENMRRTLAGLRDREMGEKS